MADEEKKTESQPKTWWKRQEVQASVLGTLSTGVMLFASPITVAYKLAMIGLGIAGAMGWNGINLGKAANNLKFTKENYKVGG